MSEKTCPNNIAAHDSLSRVGGSGAGGLGGRAGRRGAAGASPGDGEFLPPEPLRLLSSLFLLLGPGDEPQGFVPQVHKAPVDVADQSGKLEFLLPSPGQDSIAFAANSSASLSTSASVNSSVLVSTSLSVLVSDLIVSLLPFSRHVMNQPEKSPPPSVLRFDIC